MSELVSLCIGYGTQAVDRFRPLMDGEIKVEGCTMRFVPLAPGEMLVRSFQDPELNVAELSLSNYISQRSQKICPYMAMPVHISRSFRHGDIYVRADGGIVSPQDLRGRRVGITEYQHTAHVWVRGILHEEYGVHPSELHWVSGRLDVNRHPVPQNPVLPPNVAFEMIPEDQTLSQMLFEGRLDAIVSPQLPSVFVDQSCGVRRLFAPLAAVEESYFRSTRIFPVLHVMGIRNDVMQQNPWLPERLYNAFLASKNLYLARAAESEMPSVRDGAARMNDLMGPDWYPYGLDGNSRGTLNAFCRYHRDQGLSEQIPELDELFVPNLPA